MMAAYPRSTLGFEVPCACVRNAFVCLSSACEQPRASNRERPKVSSVQGTGCYPVIKTHAKQTKRATRTWFRIVRIRIRATQPSAMGIQSMVSRDIQGWYPGVSGGGILGYPGVSGVSAHHPAHCCPPNDTNYNGTRRAKGYPGWAKQMLYNIRRSATPFRSPKGAPPLVALYACEPQWFGLRRARNIPQVHTLDF